MRRTTGKLCIKPVVFFSVPASSAHPPDARSYGADNLRGALFRHNTQDDGKIVFRILTESVRLHMQPFFIDVPLERSVIAQQLHIPDQSVKLRSDSAGTPRKYFHDLP